MSAAGRSPLTPFPLPQAGEGTLRILRASPLSPVSAERLIHTLTALILYRT
jgi:hypothetical protein